MVNRLATAGIALTLALAGLIDLVAASGTGFAPLAGSFGLAAAALVLVARRDRIPRTQLMPAGLATGGLSLLLSVTARAAWPGSAIATWSLLETVSLALLLGTLGRRWAHSRDTVALIIVAAALVAGPGRLAESDAAVFSLLVALASVAVLAVGLLRRADDLRAAQAVLRGRDAERREIARDLHDDAAHHLTGIIITAQAALATGSDPAAYRAALARVESTGVQALESMRALVGVLRAPDAPDAAERVAAHWPDDVHEMLERFGRHTGLTTSIALDAGDLPATHRQAVRRIVQESLTNVTRHASHPTRVSVSVRQYRTSVEVTVSDDGRATDQPGSGTRSGGGFGLVGVSERAAALGGNATAGWSGAGWCVRVHLPLLDRQGER